MACLGRPGRSGEAMPDKAAPAFKRAIAEPRTASLRAGVLDGGRRNKAP